MDGISIHADLGKAYAASGRDDEAISELRMALPSDETGEINYQLFVLYKKRGQTELANEALAQSEKLRTQARESKQHRVESVVHCESN